MGQQVPKIHPSTEEWEGEAAPSNEPVHTLSRVVDLEDVEVEKAKLEEKLANGDFTE